MPKNRSLKKPSHVPELATPVVKLESSSKLKKPSNEIDEIFSGKKRKKSEVRKTENANADETEKPKLTNKNKKSKGAKEGGFADSPVGSRKRTGDGLIIYTEDELGISKADAGGTPLCPFDCDCCF
ncbi:DUF1764 domain-containing protein [Cephalotus follicularis]|uniref:DUF1764 domain-containing protein n=1 Tax=Cephalotus follicularis TaxID=3775 RepID=A0A1Q3B091_CEPFO|nr:DUF1764 domain-containing protein [Cephalotus follicularis]